MPFDPAPARLALAPFDWHAPPVAAPALQGYLSHYGLDAFAGDALQHGIGRVETAGHTIAVQSWRQRGTPRGTVLVLHGYYDHVGLFRHVIAHLAGLGHDVVAFDLPGHGLSSGAPAVIDDFGTYQRVLQAVLAGMLPACTARAPAVHFVGQSTGAGIALHYLVTHRGKPVPFSQAILLAPLVRPVNWTTNRLLYYALRPFVEAMPRQFAVNSHDEAFLHFLRNEDPLQARELSVRWVGAMNRWIPLIEHAAPVSFPLTVIQGDEDGTVDWRHNLGVIRRVFPQAEVHLVPGGRHQLANEAPAWREPVLSLVTQALAKTPGGTH